MKRHKLRSGGCGRFALLFWGNRWTLVAWCELRVDFRSFRVDRFQTLFVLEERFTPGPGQRYEDFLERVKATERADRNRLSGT